MVAGDRTTARVEGPVGAKWTETGPVGLEEAMAVLEPVDAVWSAPDEPTLVTSGQAERLTAGGNGRFQRIRKDAGRLFDRLDASEVPEPARPRLVGGFSFFGTETLSAPWTGFAPAAFTLPEIQLAIEEERTWITVVGAGTDGREARLDAALDSTIEALDRYSDRSRREASEYDPNGKGATGQDRQVVRESVRTTQEDWANRIRKITRTIEDSALQKVVLAQALDLEFDDPTDVASVLADLEITYPDCYRFGFRAGERATEQASPVRYFVGASPERLVAKTGQDVSTEALAGTVDRGVGTADDAAKETQLRTDPKIEAEHTMVVEEIESQLDRLAATVSTGDRTVRKLETVQHLQTSLAATVPPPTHVLDVVEALHPTPAVGGRPPDAAMAVIRERDPVERGWYAAPVGWFDAAGDGTFAVGIRSGVTEGERATLFAGNGIVADSDTEEEWAEVHSKFRPIRSALG